MIEKIKEVFKKELNLKVIDIKQITEGYSHFMYEVKTDKDSYIIRFSNNSGERHNLLKEKFVMDLLQKNNIPIPKIYVFNKECMILEKIKGIRLDTIWKDLSQQEKIKITEKSGKLLSKIHKIKLDKFGSINENGIKSFTNFEFKKIGEKIRFSPFLREHLMLFGEDFMRLITYRHLSPDFLAEFIRYIYKNLDKIDYNKEPTFTHGDFHTGHIFVKKIKDSYEIVGIIDFEFARSSSPEYDFIKLQRSGFFDDIKLKNALKKGYGKINEESVYIHRLMRDLGFASVILEAGNRELSDKIIKDINEKIKQD